MHQIAPNASPSRITLNVDPESAESFTEISMQCFLRCLYSAYSLPRALEIVPVNSRVSVAHSMAAVAEAFHEEFLMNMCLNYASLHFTLSFKNVNSVWVQSNSDDFSSLVLRGRCVKYVHDNLHTISRKPAMFTEWHKSFIAAVVECFPAFSSDKGSSVASYATVDNCRKICDLMCFTFSLDTIDVCRQGFETCQKSLNTIVDSSPATKPKGYSMYLVSMIDASQYCKLTDLRNKCTREVVTNHATLTTATEKVSLVKETECLLKAAMATHAGSGKSEKTCIDCGTQFGIFLHKHQCPLCKRKMCINCFKKPFSTPAVTLSSSSTTTSSTSTASASTSTSTAQTNSSTTPKHCPMCVKLLGVFVLSEEGLN